QSDVDDLPVARAIAMAKRGQRAEGAEDTGEIIRNGGRPRAHGGTIGMARQIRGTADGRRDAAEARPLARGPGLAEGRDADHHETTIHRREVGPAETPALHRPGTEVLGENVRGSD